MSDTKLTVRHVSTLGKKNTEVFNCNPSVINVNISSDTAVAIDTFAKALTLLSNDTYDDSEISQVKSINEILAE